MLWEVVSFALNVGYLRTWQPHQCLVWDVLAPPVKLVQVEPVVVCLVQLEAVGMASLPRMVLACLVGLVAHRLVELVVSNSACVCGRPRDLNHTISVCHAGCHAVPVFTDGNAT